MLKVCVFCTSNGNVCKPVVCLFVVEFFIYLCLDDLVCQIRRVCTESMPYAVVISTVAPW